MQLIIALDQIEVYWYNIGAGYRYGYGLRNFAKIRVQVCEFILCENIKS